MVAMSGDHPSRITPPDRPPRNPRLKLDGVCGLAAAESEHAAADRCAAKAVELLRLAIAPGETDAPHPLKEPTSIRYNCGPITPVCSGIWPSLGDGSEARSDRFLADLPPANPAKVIYTLVSVEPATASPRPGTGPARRPGT